VRELASDPARDDSTITDLWRFIVSGYVLPLPRIVIVSQAIRSIFDAVSRGPALGHRAISSLSLLLRPLLSSDG
jgi:hypothetical protein